MTIEFLSSKVYHFFVLGEKASVVKHPDNLQPEGQFATREPERWAPGERADIVKRQDNLKP